MHGEPPSAADLRLVKSFSAGRFVLGLETSAAIAGSLVDLDVYGLPPDSLDTYRTRVQAVTQDGVAAAARRLLHPDRVGDRRGRSRCLAARAARALRSGRSGGTLVHQGRLAGRAARFAVVAVLALVTACASTPKTKPVRVQPAPRPAPNSRRGRSSGRRRRRTGARLFLLGSVHIGDGRQLVLDTRIEQDWAQAQDLVVELDTSTLSPIDAVDATNRFGLLPRGTTLRSVVCARHLQQVAKYMKARDYPMERIDRMRPWLVAQVVTQLEYTAAGLDAENGVDVVMMRRAAGRKGIVPLESLEEQAALFAGLPVSLQETMLVEILREAQALLAVTRATLTAWEQGDEKTLAELLFGNSSGDAALGEFYERVFYGRNRTMADRVVALSADAKPRFVVVGTGHLIGPQGIPALLAQRGFRVERVGSARVLQDAAATRAAGIPAPAAAPVAPGSPAPAVAPIVIPVPDAPVVPPSTPTPEPGLPTTPVPVPAQQTAPVVPATEAPSATPEAVRPAAPPLRTAPLPPSGVPQDSWLGQDAAPALPPGEPGPPVLMAPSPPPTPPEVAPAPAQEPAPAPPPAAPKPKKKRLSSPKL